MIIWGSKGRAKKKSSGLFFCPNCRRQTDYVFYEVGNYFTLYFIPLFQTEKISEYVECERCKNKYDTDILNTDIDQSFTSIISKITDSSSQGIPIQLLVNQLIDNGIDEKTAKELVVFSIGDKIATCPSCGYLYSSAITHCSMCGTKLSRPNFY